MPSWQQFTSEGPELEAKVRARFEAHLHHIVGTLRADGSPRLSGTEARFFDGEIWLGCMPSSIKARDMRRDPRISLHSAPVDVEMKSGDAKVSGRAVEVTDPDRIAAFLIAVGHGSADDPPDPSEALAFTIDLSLVTLTSVAGDHLDVVTWREGRGVETVAVS